MIIRNQSQVEAQASAIRDTAMKSAAATPKTRRTRKAKRSLGTIGIYSGVFVVVISLISIGYRAPQDLSVASVASDVPTVSSAPALAAAPSVDKIMSTDVAGHLATQVDMPVANNIANLSVSLDAQAQLEQTSDTVISKPQIIQPTAANREITKHLTKEGETVQSVAVQYNLQPDTVRWANNLEKDSIDTGKELTIPPVDGVVYTTKAGDTPAAIAQKYKSDEARVVSFNDLEISGMTAGKQIVIPGGVMPEELRPGYQAPVGNVSREAANNAAGTGYRVNTKIAQASAGNRYAYGNCTWYAYERRAQMGKPVGSFWGNANTWGIYARSAGYLVDKNPSYGAVLVDTAGYYGHVAVVESVNPETGDVTISEMNNYAYGGFGIVNKRTLTAGQAAAYSYIH